MTTVQNAEKVETTSTEATEVSAPVTDAGEAPKKTRKPRAKKEVSERKPRAKKTEKKEKAAKEPKAKKEPKPKALKTPKPPKEKKVKAEPKSGQSGPALDLTKEKLNSKEVKVVSVLHEDINPLPITAIAAAAFGEETSGTGNSWVRNSLRRLARGKWVERMGRGTYKLTALGTERFQGKVEKS